MTIKRQIQFKYHNFISALRFLSLPKWIDGNTIRFVFVGVIVLVGAAYVFKTTSSTTSGYELHKLETQTAALEQDIEKTNIQIAENSSLSNIQDRLAKMDMVAAGGIKYLSVGIKDVTVAKQ